MAKLMVKECQAPVIGTLEVPFSKYHLHRALVLGSLAAGDSHIAGRSEAGHISDTLGALYHLGITVDDHPQGYVVHGEAYRPRGREIPVGSSGSTLQFLLGLGSQVSETAVTFDGSPALRERPIGPLLDALGAVGIRCVAAHQRLPVTVFPGKPQGGTVRMSGFLSQWVSGILLLAPLAQDSLTVALEPPVNERTYIQLTIDMMRQFGVVVEAGPLSYTIPTGQRYRPAQLEIERDLSSAAFPLGLAALHPARVVLHGIQGPGGHPEGRILEIIEQMGVPLTRDPELQQVLVHNPHRPRLQGITLDMTDIPDLFPMMAVLGSLAQGRTVLRGIHSVRCKESDRVRAMLQLRKMGADIEDQGDAVVIHGVDQLQGAEIYSYDDHRVLMAFAIAASRAHGTTWMSHPLAYRISYPEFLDDMRRLGLTAELRMENTWVPEGVGA